MTSTPEPPLDDTPLWLSHHWSHEYDRCTVLAGRHVCRRCLVLYPVAALTALVLAHLVRWPSGVEPWLLGLLPLPAVVDFVAEQLRWVRHSPVRQVVVTALLAVGCGGLYVRYLDDRTDGLVWAVGGAYLGVCLAAWLTRAFKPGTAE